MKNQFRDLTVISLNTETSLVIACDSSAGIGEQPLDAVQIDPAVSAAYSLRVPLMELLCVGADPLTVVDTIGNELVPTGERIIHGLKSELNKAGLNGVSLNGSTEDNMLTKTTSVGVTVIGQISGNKIPTMVAMMDQLVVYQLGTPYVGEEVKPHLATIFSYDQVQQIRHNPAVVDMLPVGSKGIAYELEQLAATHSLAKTRTDIDLQSPVLTKSAGPATVVLIGVKATRSD